MTDLAHRGEVLAENFLKHFGTKGMRWGVRKDRSGPTHVDLHQNRLGQIKKTSGGTGHPTSEDAKKALSYRQIAKGSGTHALANHELQALNKRMELEQRYTQLSSSRSNRAKVKNGTGVARDILATGNTVNEAIKFANSDAGKALRKGLVR